MRKEGTLTYALKDGKLVHASEVPNGLECGCICPSCGEPLIANQGSKKIHYFSHKPGSECIHGYESSLHLLAKEILSESNIFKIPPVVVSMGNYSETLFRSSDVNVDHVDLEKDFDGGAIRPDVIVYSDKVHKFFVEIFVTHKVDDEKLQRIKQLGISTIEIDLSSEKEYLSKESLTKIMLDESPNKKWIFNRHVENRKKSVLRDVRYLPVKRIPFGWIIYDCPQAYMSYQNKDYAILDSQCKNCPFYFGISDDNNERTSLKQDKKWKMETNVLVKCKGHSVPNMNNQISDQQKFFDKYRNKLNCPICGNSLFLSDGMGNRTYTMCSQGTSSRKFEMHYEFITKVRNHRIVFTPFYPF